MRLSETEKLSILEFNWWRDWCWCMDEYATCNIRPYIHSGSRMSASRAILDLAYT